jgi:WD40 repeat protein
VNATSGELLSSIYVIQQAIRIILLDNDTFAISNLEVVIWNIKTKEEVLKLTGHTRSIWGLVKIKQNDVRLASGSFDSTIKIWNYTNGRLLNNLIGHHDEIYNLVSFNDERIASSSKDKRIFIWNTISGKILYALEGH